MQSSTGLVEGCARKSTPSGRSGHLISPNKLHYAHIPAWKRVYPEATAWASPGVRKRAAAQRIDVSFEADLTDEPEPAWREDLDPFLFRGSHLLEETLFFHRERVP